jgi:hypothetical protein
VTKSGKTALFDVSRGATLPFGFIHQDTVQTPLGVGSVFGVSEGNLWFHIGSDSGLSYWGTCKNEQEFARKGVMKVADPVRPPIAPPDSSFRLKKAVLPDGRNVRIVMQQINGACPLIGIANALILRGVLDSGTFTTSDYVTVQQLSEIIAGIIKQRNQFEVDHAAVTVEAPKPTDPITGRPTLLSILQTPEHRGSEFRKYIADVEKNISILNKGLCVSPIFCGVDAFDYTLSLLVFPLLDTRVLHAWIVSPEDPLFGTLFVKSYDMLTEIQVSGATDPGHLEELALVDDFLQLTACQVTEVGLTSLGETMMDGEIAVYFCNNHFSTITNHGGVVYRLVTDVGYVDHADIVWEKLTFRGDGGFHNAFFIERKSEPAAQPAPTTDKETILLQVMTDYPIAEYEEIRQCYDKVVASGTVATKENVARRWNEDFGMKGIGASSVTAPQQHQTAPARPPSPVDMPVPSQGPYFTPIKCDDAILQQLLNMGFPYNKATEAATKHTTLESAVNALIQQQ